jgi:hypothetical protein
VTCSLPGDPWKTCEIIEVAKASVHEFHVQSAHLGTNTLDGTSHDDAILSKLFQVRDDGGQCRDATEGGLRSWT